MEEVREKMARKRLAKGDQREVVKRLLFITFSYFYSVLRETSKPEVGQIVFCLVYFCVLITRVRVRVKDTFGGASRAFHSLAAHWERSFSLSLSPPRRSRA